MSPRLPGLAAALVAALALAAVPACKKRKPPEPDTPGPAPQPNPSPNPNPTPAFGVSDLPAPPRGPIFGTSDPRTAAMRIAAEANVRQVVMALRQYHDENGALPAGFADKGGKPGLSWRVALLPYLESEPLFKMFRLDEPWDSPANKPLISKMPAVYGPPRTETFGYTFSRGFSGPNTWLGPAGKGEPGKPLRGVTFGAIRDGLSNTILVADAADAVIWTKPEELEFNPSSPPKLGGVFGSGVVVGTADGAVRFVRGGLPPKALANAIQINDGGLVDWGN